MSKQTKPTDATEEVAAAAEDLAQAGPAAALDNILAIAEVAGPILARFVASAVVEALGPVADELRALRAADPELADLAALWSMHNAADDQVLYRRELRRLVGESLARRFPRDGR